MSRKCARNCSRIFGARIVGLKARFIGLDARFIGLDARFICLDARFIGLDAQSIGLDIGFAHHLAPDLDLLLHMSTESL